jgi:CDP-glycerol glycerophosphotransferase
VWVDNFAKGHYLRLAKGRQYYIQTWHGDRAIKKIGYDEAKPSQRRLEEKCSRITTASTFGEKMYRTAFAYRGEYIKAGSPRNDPLVKNDPAERARIRRALGIDGDTGLLLYAPTYREKKEMIPREVQMDLGRTLDCLEKKTGKAWKCLFRAHYLSAGIDLEAVKGRTVDVTAYPDMTELLLAADMVLTDYSSCALDFIIMDRPALFYIPDWDNYVATRGVYFDIRESPLMTADTQEQLEALIRGLTPEQTARNCADIREYFGYYETGRATEAVCDYITERLGNLDRLPE